jgi:hypothetical protein
MDQRLSLHRAGSLTSTVKPLRGNGLQPGSAVPDASAPPVVLCKPQVGSSPRSRVNHFSFPEVRELC